MSHQILHAIEPYFIPRGRLEAALAGRLDADVWYNPHPVVPLNEEEVIALCQEHQIDAILTGLDQITRRVMEACPSLKAIVKCGVGLDNVDLEAAREFGIPVRNCKGCNKEAVAEMSILLMMSLFRNLYPCANSAKTGGWRRMGGREIFGCTAGIIGLGDIGREIARMAAGLGMKVVGYDPFPNRETLGPLGIALLERDEVLRQADAVFLCLPLTEETQHLICSATLSLMRRDAYLINPARGGLIDEDALYAALKSGRIAGAAVDVMTEEPPAPGCPLLELDNFLVTPHLGAFTEESRERSFSMSVEHLVELLGGR